MLRHIIQTLLLLVACHYSLFAQRTIHLYTDSIPNARPSSVKERSAGEDLQIFNVTDPTLTVHYAPRSAKPTAAVIICPGGGYGSLYINREGHEMARAFAARGVTAFVLKYRLPSAETMREPSIGPLQDAQQAIRYIRQHAAEYNVDPAKVGIMGYSAGGHLAASAGILHERELIPNPEKTSLRPDFMILMYPVITMDTVKGHNWSTYNLLGLQPTAEQIAAFSLEQHVNQNTSPAFVAVAADDHLLDNSMLVCAALKHKSVPFELHVYARGGHGFLRYPAFSDWTKLLFDWMRLNKWI